LRAVFDTNVVVRAMINPHGTWGQLLRMRGAYTMVGSSETLAELMQIIGRPALRRWLAHYADHPARAAVVAALDDIELVEPASLPPVCRDPEDDKFFACAVAGGAAYIVSEDRDMLSVGEYRGIRAVRAGEFLRLLTPAPPGA
jgi:putative PIN family toxin of toxin-antitoxin system